MVKVLDFGSLNIDMTYRVPHVVREGETLTSLGSSVNAGGKGANQSAAAAKAGLSVYHAGKIGEDGLFLLDLLSSFGVDTSLTKVEKGSGTGKAIIQVDEEGQNSIILIPGTNREMTGDYIDSVLENFGKGDWIILQNEINLIGEIVKKAHDKGLVICFNPAPFDEHVSEVDLSLVDTVFVNEIEGASMAGLPVETSYEKILDTLCERYPGMEIVLTVGAHGALYGKDSERFTAEPVPCSVCDTTAAGDTFIGYFAASRIKGLSVKEAMEKASLASSIAVSRKGAMASIPLKEEVFI